jgi:hypothetical protein
VRNPTIRRVGTARAPAAVPSGNPQNAKWCTATLGETHPNAGIASFVDHTSESKYESHVFVTPYLLGAAVAQSV